MVSAADFNQTCNYSDLDYYCTPATCCLEQGELTYLPTVAGNGIYAAVFIILIIPNLWFGIRSKTWSFMTWMILGLVGEAVGYIGRIQLHNNIFDFNAFLTYLIPLTIAPAFITASIYLCLARIIYIVDPALQHTRLKPMTYTKIFVTFDFICLVLQGAGGGMAATANTKADGDAGVNVMIAGLAFQVVSLVTFSAICLDFAWRLRRSGASTRTSQQTRTSESAIGANIEETSPAASLDSVRRSKMFKGFIWTIGISVTLIFVRSAYRTAELQDGFNSKLFNDEVSFMIFEGPMIIIACTLLTVFHPSLSMRGFWNLKGVQGEKQNEKAVKGEGWMKKSLKMVSMRRN